MGYGTPRCPSQISQIRSQMAATAESFRGYRAAPAAFSALVAIGAALVQRCVGPQPGGFEQLPHALIGAAAEASRYSPEMSLRLLRHGLTLHRQYDAAGNRAVHSCLVAGDVDGDLSSRIRTGRRGAAAASGR